MKKVFLIGGAGFIGSNIAKLLVKDGWEVIIYDLFLSFIDPFVSDYDNVLKERFKDIKDKIVFERGDIRFQRQISSALQKHQPDVVVHLAATASAKESSLFPEEAASINSDGLINVLESLKFLDNIKRFVFTSSSFVYGNFQYSPADEVHPQNPIDIYGASKLAGEGLTKAYCAESDIPYTIIRPTAVYGFGDINRRVSQIFIENAFKRRPIVLHGGGVSRVDFTYVEDTAAGFLLAFSEPAGENEVFNIARGEGREIREYAAEVKKIFPDLDIRVEPSDLTRPERGSLDISKAKKLLGFTPRISLEEGIKRYVEDYRNFYENRL